MANRNRAHRSLGNLGAVLCFQWCLIGIVFTSVLGCDGGDTDSRDSRVFPRIHDMAFVRSRDSHRPDRSFFVDKFEVTNQEFVEFVNESSYRPADSRGFLKHLEESAAPGALDQLPVVWVNLHDARAYAQWRGKAIPTGYEWQLTARSDRQNYPFVSSFQPLYANVLETDIGVPVPVGMFESGRSSTGCYDLLGNVWEWTQSTFDEDSDEFLIRGGSFYDRGYDGLKIQADGANDNDLARGEHPGDRNDHLGFRCVLAAKPFFLEALRRLETAPPEAYQELLAYPDLADLAGFLDASQRRKWEIAIPPGTRLVGVHDQDSQGHGFMVIQSSPFDQDVPSIAQEEDSYETIAEQGKRYQLAGLDGVTGRTLYRHNLQTRILEEVGNRNGSITLTELKWVESPTGPRISISWDFEPPDPIGRAFSTAASRESLIEDRSGFLILEARTGRELASHSQLGLGCRVRRASGLALDSWVGIVQRSQASHQLLLKVPESGRRVVQSLSTGRGRYEPPGGRGGTRLRLEGHLDEKEDRNSRRKGRERASSEQTTEESWKLNFPVPNQNLGDRWPGRGSVSPRPPSRDPSLEVTLGSQGMAGMAFWVDVVVVKEGSNQGREKSSGVVGRGRVHGFLDRIVDSFTSGDWSQPSPPTYLFSIKGDGWYRAQIDGEGELLLSPGGTDDMGALSGGFLGDRLIWVFGPDRQRRVTIYEQVNEEMVIRWASDQEGEFEGPFLGNGEFDLAELDGDNQRYVLHDSSGEFMILDANATCVYRHTRANRLVLSNRVSLTPHHVVYAQPKWLTLFDTRSAESKSWIWVGPWADLRHGAADFDGDGNLELCVAPLARALDRDSKDPPESSQALVVFSAAHDPTPHGILLRGYLKSYEQEARRPDGSSR